VRVDVMKAELKLTSMLFEMAVVIAEVAVETGGFGGELPTPMVIDDDTGLGVTTFGGGAIVGLETIGLDGELPIPTVLDDDTRLDVTVFGSGRIVVVELDRAIPDGKGVPPFVLEVTSFLVGATNVGKVIGIVGLDRVVPDCNKVPLSVLKVTPFPVGATSVGAGTIVPPLFRQVHAELTWAIVLPVHGEAYAGMPLMAIPP
jgi:hypothetical protein